MVNSDVNSGISNGKMSLSLAGNGKIQGGINVIKDEKWSEHELDPQQRTFWQELKLQREATVPTGARIMKVIEQLPETPLKTQ